VNYKRKFRSALSKLWNLGGGLKPPTPPWYATGDLCFNTVMTPFSGQQACQHVRDTSSFCLQSAMTYFYLKFIIQKHNISLWTHFQVHKNTRSAARLSKVITFWERPSDDLWGHHNTGWSAEWKHKYQLNSVKINIVERLNMPWGWCHVFNGLMVSLGWGSNARWRFSGVTILLGWNIE
jgi:hypothetical protein